jgi:hypothetical protein
MAGRGLLSMTSHRQDLSIILKSHVNILLFDARNVDGNFDFGIGIRDTVLR